MLREYLGGINYSRWVKLLALAGVTLKWAPKGAGNRRIRLTYDQCRAIMAAYYRQVGEFRMKRWKRA